MLSQGPCAAGSATRGGGGGQAARGAPGQAGGVGKVGPIVTRAPPSPCLSARIPGIDIAPRRRSASASGWPAALSAGRTAWGRSLRQEKAAAASGLASNASAVSERRGAVTSCCGGQPWTGACGQTARHAPDTAPRQHRSVGTARVPASRRTPPSCPSRSAPALGSLGGDMMRPHLSFACREQAATWRSTRRELRSHPRGPAAFLV